MFCFRLSVSRPAYKETDLHTTNKYRPQIQNVGSKTNVNHVHRRGEQILSNLPLQSTELASLICTPIDRRFLGELSLILKNLLKCSKQPGWQRLRF